MDADTRAKLAEGVAALVRVALAGVSNRVYAGDSPHDGQLLFSTTIQTRIDSEVQRPLPPLTTLQTLGLRLLLGDTDAGLVAAAVDAMVESGVIPADQCEMVRQVERERIAGHLDDKQARRLGLI